MITHFTGMGGSSWEWGKKQVEEKEGQSMHLFQNFNQSQKSLPMFIACILPMPWIVGMAFDTCFQIWLVEGNRERVSFSWKVLPDLANHDTWIMALDHLCISFILTKVLVISYPQLWTLIGMPNKIWTVNWQIVACQSRDLIKRFKFCKQLVHV